MASSPGGGSVAALRRGTRFGNTEKEEAAQGVFDVVTIPAFRSDRPIQGPSLRRLRSTGRSPLGGPFVVGVVGQPVAETGRLIG